MMILLIAKQEVPQTYPPDVLAIRKGKITSLKFIELHFCGGSFISRLATQKANIQYHIPFLDPAY